MGGNRKTTDFLRDLMGRMIEMDLPVVFEGYMLLSLLFAEMNSTDVRRETRDIDAFWLGELDVNDVAARIEGAVKAVDPSCSVHVFRDFGPQRSAGIKICDAFGIKVAHIDLDGREPSTCDVYELSGVSFTGVHVNKIVADKVLVLSGARIFRRAKDLVDLHSLLGSGIRPDLRDLRTIWEAEGRIPGHFASFLNEWSTLEHAYDKLERIENKPSFETAYGRVRAYLVDIGLIEPA